MVACLVLRHGTIYLAYFPCAVILTGLQVKASTNKWSCNLFLHRLRGCSVFGKRSIHKVIICLLVCCHSGLDAFVEVAAHLRVEVWCAPLSPASRSSWLVRERNWFLQLWSHSPLILILGSMKLVGGDESILSTKVPRPPVVLSIYWAISVDFKARDGLTKGRSINMARSGGAWRCSLWLRLTLLLRDEEKLLVWNDKLATGQRFGEKADEELHFTRGQFYCRSPKEELHQLCELW